MTASETDMSLPTEKCETVLLVYLDFEATGLSKWHDHITQIGAVATRYSKDTKKSESVAIFETLVLTNRKIAEKAVEITGITNEMLAGYPKTKGYPPSEALKEKPDPKTRITAAPKTKIALTKFFTWLNGARKPNENVVFSAWNGINYDYPLLCSEMTRWDMNIIRQFKACGIIFLQDPLPWARHHIDTTLLLRNKKGNASFKLGDVHLSLIGTSFENAHSALADTQAMYTVCSHEAFGNMVLLDEEDTSYFLETKKYIMDFIDKRRSIDAAIKSNVKNKILSLFDMVKKKPKKRALEEDISVQEPVKKKQLISKQELEK